MTGGTSPVDTGANASNALFLAGEIFVCADDVVVVGEGDLNEVAVAAQLAAALGGPLLLPHPQLAAELGRLKPETVHLVGSVTVGVPPTAETSRLDVTTAVQMAREVLGTGKTVTIPATPDHSTVVQTVLAITDRDRVASPPPVGLGGTSTTLGVDLDAAEVVTGLAQPHESEIVWMVDAANPVGALLAAAQGRSIGAAVVAVDPQGLLVHPEVGAALQGRPAEAVRPIGIASVDDWELAVLSNGVELPGGGFYILPREGKRRYVAFYGHPETRALGVLGEQNPEATLQRMGPFLEAYTGDGSQVVPTFEMIAAVAAANATDDGDYSFEWPVETFLPWIETARQNGAHIVLDLQPGRDDFLTQAKMYQELLELPFVGLALDPEWRLEPDQVHLVQVGHVDAAEVNMVIHWLADLVREKGLPQKLMIVHQFRTFMIQNRETLEQRPEIQLIIQMDGDGTEPQKDDTYAALNQGAEDAFWSWGWKNFFDEDEPGPPSPEATMGKIPTPVYVSYQ